MSFYVVIVDGQTPFHCARLASSVLTLPLGERSFLDHLIVGMRAVAPRGACEFLILTPQADDAAHSQALVAATTERVRAVTPAALAEVLGGCTAADDVLVFDACRWPMGDCALEDHLEEYLKRRTPTHLVAIGAEQERARERVERDLAGQVTRVQRIYHKQSDAADWADRVFLSLSPAALVRDLPLDSTQSLRTALAAAGVACQDVPLALDLADLTQTAGILAVSEHHLSHLGREMLRVNGDGRRALRTGKDCRVDPSARIVGTVVLHDRVVVEAGATLVGPTVVGSGVTIRSGAIVVQAVLAPGTLVREGVTVRHCVAGGTCQACAAGTLPAEKPRSGLARDRLQESGARPGVARSWSRSVQFAVKRLIDVVCSAGALLVLAPLLVVVAVLVKISSPGPLFFCHRREQRGGKEFPCIKFRTMCADAHSRQMQLAAENEVDGPQFKLRHDPRVTRVGGWLRKTNLDELPQLFNVLAGHMSLVGPRPSPFQENQICVPWRRARLSVRPGITGLWQICRSADRSAGDFHEWIFYDITYVRRFSLWLDLKILVATVLTCGGRSSVPLRRLIRTPEEVWRESPSESNPPVAAAR